MSFGKKANKENTPKAKVDEKAKELRDNAIIKQISIIVEDTDAGCTDVKRIIDKLPGVENIHDYIDKSIKKYGFIKHKGWVYGKLWNIRDVNSISNTIVHIDNFDENYVNIDHNLMKHLRQINNGAGAKTMFLEALCDKGVLQLSKKQLYQSLLRLVNEGKIYEPVIGTFVPLDFKS